MLEINEGIRRYAHDREGQTTSGKIVEKSKPWRPSVPKSMGRINESTKNTQVNETG